MAPRGSLSTPLPYISHRHLYSCALFPLGAPSTPVTLTRPSGVPFPNYLSPPLLPPCLVHLASLFLHPSYTGPSTPRLPSGTRELLYPFPQHPWAPLSPPTSVKSQGISISSPLRPPGSHRLQPRHAPPPPPPPPAVAPAPSPGPAQPPAVPGPGSSLRPGPRTRCGGLSGRERRPRSRAARASPRECRRRQGRDFREFRAGSAGNAGAGGAGTGALGVRRPWERAPAGNARAATNVPPPLSRPRPPPAFIEPQRGGGRVRGNHRSPPPSHPHWSSSVAVTARLIN